MGPKKRSSGLEGAIEDFVIYYRLTTRFSLEECLMRLRVIFPRLTRSSLYRCFRRRGVSRLAWGALTTIKEAMAQFPAGHFIVSVQEKFGAPAIFSAIELSSGRIFLRRLDYSVGGAKEFIARLMARFPGRVEEISTPHDEEIFHYPPKDRVSRHPFYVFCENIGVVHSPHALEQPGLHIQ